MPSGGWRKHKLEIFRFTTPVRLPSITRPALRDRVLEFGDVKEPEETEP